MDEYNKQKIEHLDQQIIGLKWAVAQLTHLNQDLWVVINDMLRREAMERDAIDALNRKVEEGGSPNHYLKYLHRRIMRLLYHSGFVEERIESLEMRVFRKLPDALREVRNILGDPHPNLDTDKFDRRGGKG